MKSGFLSAADVLNDSEQPLALALEVFDDASRQNRLEASELHHDRAPLAGVVRELEAQPAIDALFSGRPEARVVRFRQAIGVLVRMIMEGRGGGGPAERARCGYAKREPASLRHAITPVVWHSGSSGPSDMSSSKGSPSSRCASDAGKIYRLRRGNRKIKQAETL